MYDRVEPMTGFERNTLVLLFIYTFVLLFPHTSQAAEAKTVTYPDSTVRVAVADTIHADMFRGEQAIPLDPASEDPKPKEEPKPTIKKIVRPSTPSPIASGSWMTTITAYSSTPDQTDGDPFTAASGAKVHPGMVALNGVPFGTHIKIPDLFGDRIFVVEDRSGRQGIVDVWMETRQQALQFGKHHTRVEIVP